MCVCHDLNSSRTYLNNNAKLGASLSALVSGPLIATTCMYGREEKRAGELQRGGETERERKRKRESQWF